MKPLLLSICLMIASPCEAFLRLPPKKCCYDAQYNVSHNLNIAWDMYREGNLDEAIDYVSGLIYGPCVKPEEAVHYLVCRSNFNLSKGNLIGYKADMWLLKKLCQANDCARLEAWRHYEIWFD